MLNKCSLVILFFCSILLSCQARSSFSSSRSLKELDDVVNDKNRYFALKQARIDSLKTVSDREKDPERKVKVLSSLYFEYSAFNKEASMFCVQQMSRISEQYGLSLYRDLSKLYQARVLCERGQFDEALTSLNNLERNNRDYNFLIEYYLTNVIIHEHWAEFSSRGTSYSDHWAIAQTYRDSLLACPNVPPHIYAFTLGGFYLNSRQFDKAISFLESVFNDFGSQSHNQSVIAYCIAEAYRQAGDIDKSIEYYTLSCIGDIKNGVKESSSIITLSNLLFQQGDVERAYKYVKCSLEDAISCDARINTLKMSDLFMTIQKTAQEKEQRRHQSILILLFVMSLLLVALIISLSLIFKQNIRSSKYNKELKENAILKEMYVGLFMEQVSKQSQHVESIRRRGLRLAKQIKSDQMEEFFKENFKSEGNINAFYQEFDGTILTLFPDFVEQFNKLLRDEYAFIPKNSKSLTPELRIYALIRLGINDNEKIAQFLQYSLSTIYNYKTKVKGMSKDDKETFNEKVMQLCT